MGHAESSQPSSPEPRGDQPNTERVASLVQRFIERCEGGDALSPESFVATVPAELRGDVERRCRAYLRIESLFELDRELGEQAAAEPEADLPLEIGDYRPRRLLGSGGMGAVYLAEQKSLGRSVALKVFTPRPGEGPERSERFRREALAVARLRHANIVQVLDYGEDGPHRFFAMEYVEGPSLAEVIRQRRDGHLSDVLQELTASAGARGAPSGGLPFTRAGFVVAAGIGLRIAEALAYSHDQGIIHRDVKPSNILLREDGVPLLADFGLAKEEEAEGLSLSGDVLGTPHYMSPEQTRREAVDVRTDVYSLGVTLYELIAGRLPFDGRTVGEVFQQVQSREAQPLRRVRRDVPVDLETIVAKAMERNPERRYESAAALAEDLRRFLEHRPIVARPVGFVTRWVRLSRRQPARVLGATLLLLLIVAAPVFWSLWREAVLEKTRAEEATRQREGLRLLTEASTLLESSPGLALLLAIEGAERAPGIHANRTLYQAWQRNRAPGSELRVLSGHHGTIRTIAVTPDGRRVVSGSGDTTARVWDVESGAELQRLEGHYGEIIDVDISDDGARVATASTDGSVGLWDARSGERIAALVGHEGPTFLARCLPDGALTASLDGTLRQWDAAGREIAVVSRELPFVGYGRYLEVWGEVELSVVTSTDATRVAAITRDGRVAVWELGREGELFGEQLSAPVQRIALSGNGRTLVAVTRDRLVAVDLDRGTRVLEWERSGVRDVAISADGSTLAIASDTTPVSSTSNQLQVVEVESGSTLATLERYGPAVLGSLVLASDGRSIAWCRAAGGARVWPIGEEPIELRGHELLVLRAAFPSDGRSVFTAGQDGTVRQWRLESRLAHRYAVADRPVMSTGYVGAGHAIVGARSGVARILDLETSAVTAELQSSSAVTAAAAKGHDRFEWVVAGREVRMAPRSDGGSGRAVSLDGWNLGSADVSPQGDLVAIGARRGLEGRVALLDARTGTVVRELHGHVKAIRDVTFDASGERLVTASYDGTVRAWSTRTGEALGVYRVGSDARAVGLSHDGRRLIAGVWNKDATIWDCESGRMERVLSGHRQSVEAVEFSSDGALAATGSLDGTVRIWRVEDGRCLAVLEHPAGVHAIAFGPNDDELLAGCGDGAAYRWPYPPLPVALAERTRSLTDEERVRFRVGTLRAPEPRENRVDVAVLLHEAWRVARSPGRSTAEYEAARERLREAQRLTGRASAAADLLGALAYRVGEVGEARRLLESARAQHRARVEKDDFATLCFLALTYTSQGDSSGAHECLRALPTERAPSLALRNLEREVRAAIIPASE